MDGSRESAARQWTTDELIEHCRAGENVAWQEFLRRYERLIYSTILRSGLPPADQPDVFQACVIAIYRGLKKLRNPERLTSWIIAISSRQAVSGIRRLTRENRRFAPGGDAPRFASEAPLPSEERDRLERAQQAEEALAALSGRCRRLLRYLFHEDPTPNYEEIARREEIPVGSLGPTRARCLERMRRYFEERGWSA